MEEGGRGAGSGSLGGKTRWVVTCASRKSRPVWIAPLLCAVLCAEPGYTVVGNRLACAQRVVLLLMSHGATALAPRTGLGWPRGRRGLNHHLSALSFLLAFPCGCGRGSARESCGICCLHVPRSTRSSWHCAVAPLRAAWCCATSRGASSTAPPPPAPSSATTRCVSATCAWRSGRQLRLVVAWTTTLK